MIKKRLHIFALLALVLSVNAFAQESKVFRASGSGSWSDNANWEVADHGIWLPAADNQFPGEEHNREVTVRIDDGNALVIKKGDVVHINSLYVAKGNLVVLGDLVIGDAKNEGVEENPIGTDGNTDEPGTLDAPSTPVAATSPVLLQNVPNPVMLGADQTTFKFYLDKPYEFARLTVFDELGHEVMKIYDENSVQEGWRTVTMRIGRLQSGSYPVFLELPGKVMRCLMTVVK
jgi:hypothetical protein